MPVFFRGSSEYDRNYRWNQSYRSASFSPNLEQSATDAGLRSDQVGSANGPRITSKKRVWHRGPQVQECLSWWPESDADSQTPSVNDQIPTQVPDPRSPVMKAHKKLRHRKKSPIKSSNSGKENAKDTATKGEAVAKVNHSSPKKTRPSHRSHLVKNEKEKNLSTVQSKSSEKKQKPETKKHPGKDTKKVLRDQTTANGDTSNRTAPERNIPLEHRAGLNANKPVRKSMARLSEYQRNFAAPKFHTKPSPLLSALDVVHTSSSAIPPHSGMQFHRTSEYLSKYGSSNETRKHEELSSSPASPSLKLKVKDMQKPYLSHVSKKAFRSEYSAQYNPNCEFDVGELRKMAEENKQKHEGTHIDPEHATQVISPFNKLWEVSTDGGSETPGANDKHKSAVTEQESVKENDSEEKWSRISQKGSDSVEDMTEDKCTATETDSLEDEPSEISKSSTARKLAWTEEPEDEKQSQNSGESVSVLEGRVSTPRLQEIGGALRSHHDLTTPSVGGALLISPKSARSPGSTNSSLIQKHVTARPEVAGSPTQDTHSLLKGRLHHLVRSSPQLLPSKHVPSTTKNNRPSQSNTELSKTVTPHKSRSSNQSRKMQRHAGRLSPSRAPIRGALRSEEFQHCGPTGRLQTAPALLQQIDDDVLSVASSLTSARATELLQRARQRKSFWSTTA